MPPLPFGPGASMPASIEVSPSLNPERLSANQADMTRPAAAAGKTLIVIPAHDEELNIGPVLDELEGLGLGHDVIVVDDASTDSTRHEVERRGKRCLRLSTNLGYGGAVQAGFKYALQHGYDFVVQMDGDCQHDPRSIPFLLETVRSSEADVALGSRFLGKLQYEVKPLRRIGIALFRTVVSIIMKHRITDPTSGFQAMNLRALKFFTGDSYPMDYPDSDVLLALHFAGFKIREVPVTMRPRLRGQSIHGGWKNFYYVAKMVLAIFVVLLRDFRKKAER
ncbi:MAG TPA: glycosyltransferase family 2 protein [Planctomycetota bacterium]|nr:glycosyltransferase family 2 protein [Planctomycetota bacterium]